MDAIRIIEDEHRTFASVLHGMLHLVRSIRERGAAPRFDVLGAMIYYMSAYSERIHHPRESEYLFRLLRSRCELASPILEVLEKEHRAGAEYIRTLEQSLARYEHGGASEFPAFSAAVEAYAAFLREHMRREERDVIPLARAHLLPSDWRMIDSAFSGDAVPRFGPDATSDYQHLFTRIVALAPPPIGVGAAAAPTAGSGPSSS
jgi:hemerythrin-like domain-containing protein